MLGLCVLRCLSVELEAGKKCSQVYLPLIPPHHCVHYSLTFACCSLFPSLMSSAQGTYRALSPSYGLGLWSRSPSIVGNMA